MLLFQKDTKRVLLIPMGALGAATAFSVLAATLPATAGGHRPWLVPGALSLLALAYALWTWASIRREGERLHLRSLRRRTTLQASQCGFGYYMSPGGRGGSLVVYVSDGRQRHEIARYMPLGTARVERLARRLAEVLVPEGVREEAPGARQARADREQLQAASRQVSDWYRSGGARLQALPQLNAISRGQAAPGLHRWGKASHFCWSWQPWP